MGLTAKQKSLIHVAKKRLDMDDESYRALLQRVSGVRSSKQLDAIDFDNVMREFDRLGFKSDFSKANFGVRPGMATAKQIAYIRQLWSDFTDETGTDLGLGKWLQRQFGVSAIRFLDSETARKAIGGLSNMVQRRKASTKAED